MSGLFGSSKRTATESRDTTGTSTTSTTRTKRQSRLFKEIIDQLTATAKQGTAIQPEDLNRMRAGVNQSFAQIAPRLNAALVSRGMGQPGGKPITNANLRGVDIAAGNLRAAGKSGLANLALQRFMQTAGLALPFTKPQTYTTTTTGHEEGSATRPGPSIFDQILGDASQALGIAAAFGAFGPNKTGGFGQPPQTQQFPAWSSAYPDQNILPPGISGTVPEPAIPGPDTYSGSPAAALSDFQIGNTNVPITGYASVGAPGTPGYDPTRDWMSGLAGLGFR